jgi:hypothetical protein
MGPTHAPANHERTRVSIGPIEITCIEETCEPAASLPLLSALTRDVVNANRAWLESTFFDFAQGEFVFSTPGTARR